MRSALALLVVASCVPTGASTTPPTASGESRGDSGEASPDEAGSVAPAELGPPDFGIGGGEDDAHTHVSFEAPRDVTRVSTRVVVDHTAAAGLNFFALQVDFTNGTWAHGGLQDVNGPDGTRTRQVNWGGLVDRGGGTDDYDKEEDLADLAKIQNPPVGQHVGPYAWTNGVVYELTIERGAQVTLPPGDYQLIPDRPIVHVDHARTMWAWRFTAQPVAGDGAGFVATLYDAAPGIESFVVWNESGYGSTDAALHTRWWMPRYRDANGDGAPSAWHRF